MSDINDNPSIHKLSYAQNTPRKRYWLFAITGICLAAGMWGFIGAAYDEHNLWLSPFTLQLSALLCVPGMALSLAAFFARDRKKWLAGAALLLNLLAFLLFFGLWVQALIYPWDPW